MAISLTVNGASYAYPEFRDTNWANPATNWASAVTTVLGYFQSGTGPTSGLQAPFLTSTTANAASAGMLRLAVANVISWRNNANSANLDLAVNGSNALTFNGSALGYGSVTSVAATAPAAGFTIAGSPITTSGTLTFTLADDLAALEALATTGLAVRTASNTWTTRTLGSTSAGLVITDGDGVAAAPSFALDAAIQGWDGFNSNGLLTQTAANTFTARSLAAPAAGFTITNNTGVAGNPTFVLSDDLAALEAMAGTGLVARTASNTYAQRTITGTANQITVADGDGIAGNPTLSITSNVVLPGTGGAVMPTGTTAQEGATDGALRYDTDLSAMRMRVGGVWTSIGAAGVGLNDPGSNGMLSRTAVNTVTPRTIASTSAGLVITNGDGVAGAPSFALDAAIQGWDNFNTNGMLAQTSANTFTARTIASTSAGLVITNGDGIAGAPSFALDAAIQGWDNFNTNGILVQTAANTFTGRTITGDSNEITVGNGDGVAGAPSIGIADNCVLPGTGGFVPVTGTTAQRGSTEAQVRYNSTLDQHEAIAPAGSSSLQSFSGLWKASSNRHRLHFSDDFFAILGVTVTAGSNAFAQAGNVAWTLSASGTGSGVSSAQNVAGVHPGVLRLTTGSTSGDAFRLNNGNATSTGADLERWSAIVRVVTITSVTVVIGMGQTSSSDTFGTHGVYFSFDPAVNASWMATTRSASTSTTTDTAVDVTAGNWYLLEVVRVSSGSYKFFINGTEVADHSTNLPESDLLLTAFRVVTTTAATRQLDIDYFDFTSVELGQRWT